MPKTNDNPKEMENLKRDIRRLLGIAAEENLLIFLGAGASKAAGLPTMKELSGIILKDKRSNTESKDVTQFLSEIISILETESQKGITVEQILEMIYHLEFLTKNRENKISFTIGKFKNINHQVLSSSIAFIKNIIRSKCHKINELKIKTHSSFLETFLGTPGGIRRLNIFTTNWDFTIEISCDKLNYKCIDGFIGMFNAFENFSIFDETPNDNDRLPTVCLYKLHGSLNWFLGESKEKLSIIVNRDKERQPTLPNFIVYPTPFKFKEILGYPYSDLISRFSDAILKHPHPLLLVIGYSFVDSHINKKISSMLASNEHSNIFIVDPRLTLKDISDSLGRDIEQDARVTLLQTSFEKFTAHLKGLGKNE